VTTEPFYEARFVTVNEVADLLRVSRMTVFRLIEEADPPAVRVGRGYRLREEVVHRCPSRRSPETG